MNKFHKIISIIFQPLLMPTFGMIILMNMSFFVALPNTWRWIAIIGTIIFTGLLPALPILIMISKGEISDLFISKKEQRTMPYLFSLMAYIFWSIFMWYTLQFPMFLVGMGIGSAISILTITLINFKWKISAHLAGIGGLTGGIFGVCFRMALNPTWLFVFILFISALVALSRIELKAHTPAQVLGGFVVGFLSVFMSCTFF